MSFPEVTYGLYEAKGGALSEDRFKASLPHAVAAVKGIIGYNVPEDADDEEAYVAAVCAAVDVDSAYGASGGVGEGASSVRLGNVSLDFGSGGSATSRYDRDMLRAVKGALSGSSLLYQGIS